MQQLILDSWAVMAWLRSQQPGAGLVERMVEEAQQGKHSLTINIVNVGEVYYLSVKERGLTHGAMVLTALQTMVEVISVPDDFVMAAAGIKARYAISYADAFAALTAMRARAPLVTGDRELRALAEREPDLQVRWIGA